VRAESGSPDGPAEVGSSATAAIPPPPPPGAFEETLRQSQASGLTEIGNHPHPELGTVFIRNAEAEALVDVPPEERLLAVYDPAGVVVGYAVPGVGIVLPDEVDDPAERAEVVARGLAVERELANEVPATPELPPAPAG
jgi:hypothetical protein